MLTNKTRDFKNVHMPVVLAEFINLGNPQSVLKLRLIRFQHPHIGKSPPMLDIRQYFTNKHNPDGSIYTGFSTNGVALSRYDLEKLHKEIPKIIEAIDSNDKKE
jgi:hypothetical protein